MGDDLRSMLLGTLGLDITLLGSLILTMTRGGIDADRAELLAACRLAGLAATVQAAHFVEELATGFHRRFPELLGLSAWPDIAFVSFNLFWLTIWTLSVAGMLARRTSALFPVWFLGLASVANGLGHPVMAVVTGAYFPGLATSLLSGVVGMLLVRRMFLMTQQSGLPA